MNWKSGTFWKWAGTPLYMAICGGLLFVLLEAIAAGQIASAPLGAYFCTSVGVYENYQLLCLIGICLAAPFAIVNGLKVPIIGRTRRFFKIENGDIINRGNPTWATKAAAVVAIILVPALVILSSPAVCMSPASVYYKAEPLGAWQSYALTQVGGAYADCKPGRRGRWNWSVYLRIDGATWLEIGGRGYLSASGQILASLPSVPIDRSNVAPNCPDRIAAHLPS